MKNIFYWARSRFRDFRNTLLFHPSLIASAMLAICLLMLWAEEQGLSIWMKNNIPLLVITDLDTARTILATLIGALISLMVFSFSMVMLVLNQAANNFSPRLLPGLISDPKHQQVLGFYIGTIAYCLLLLINVLPGKGEINIPGSSIFLAVILGMLCLALFIYFINLISQSVQIGNIYRRLFYETSGAIQKLGLNKDFGNTKWPNMDQWNVINAQKSGYVNNYSLDSLISKIDERDIQLAIVLPEGSFVVKGEPLYKFRGKIDEEVKRRLLEFAIIEEEEEMEQNYAVGIKQITEIILKAMSPGVNDPGTALTGIQYLKVIFSKLAELKTMNCYQKENQTLYIKLHDFGVLLTKTMAGIRRYTSSDYLIVLELIHFLQLLLKRCEEPQSCDVVKQEMMKLRTDIKQQITNERDRDILLTELGQEDVPAKN